MASYSTCKELDQREIENYDHQWFVPLDVLEELFTRKRIGIILEENDIKIYDRTEITNAILTNGLRVFAILTKIGEVGSIYRFLKFDQLVHSLVGNFDSKLPLNRETLEHILQDNTTAHQFFKTQWKFIAPILRDELSHRQLDERTILPFILFDQMNKAGGFSNIFKVLVQPSHLQHLGAEHETELVCKQVIRGISDNSLEADFDHELHIFCSLRLLKHPNIIKLVSSYTKGTTYNFLLPVAEGDLKDLLNSESGCPGFKTDDEILTSLWGLASAIQAVHDYSVSDFNLQQIGCHYDIKPRNILFRRGKLLLSDFGLSRLRNEDDGSRSLFKRGEECYLAPECEPSEQGFKRGKIGRASDIWSFGCILAEILAYLSGDPGEGPARVADFCDERKIVNGPFICRHFHGTNDVNPAVTHFLDRIIEKPKSGELKSLACLVQSILQFDPEKRPKAWKIANDLFRITQRSIIESTCEILDKCRKSSEDIELQIERQRLRVWGESFGLTSQSNPETSIAWWMASHSFEEYESIQSILQKCHQEADFILQNLQGPKTPNSYPYYHLRRLQDDLWTRLPLSIRHQMSHQLEETMLKMCSAVNLKAAQQPLGPVNEDLMRNDDDLPAGGLDYKRVVQLSLMREIATGMIQQLPSDQNLSLNVSSFVPPTIELHTHEIKTTEETGQRVLIEYLKYEEAWASRAPEFLERINAIASLRRNATVEETFPMLRCKGYYHSISEFRFGIVYELPELSKNTNPVNLVQLINDTQSRKHQPSLTQKLQLASALVSHIQSLHTGGWLHKSICAYNIIFFPDAYNNIAESLSFPYFIGLNHSRLNDEKSFSTLSGPEREYQHPAYLRNTTSYSDDPETSHTRFRQEFDYYSVGLVLMEIAFWKPLNDITKRITGSPEDLLEQLVRNYIEIVKTYAGDKYAEAVKECLTCYVGNDRPPETVRSGFNSKVVVHLSQCLV